MPHKVDAIGYPIDPELRRLEFYLCDLAAKWRGSSNVKRREEIIHEYAETMSQLFRLGWDSYLDYDCVLPNGIGLPEIYYKRTPDSK